MMFENVLKMFQNIQYFNLCSVFNFYDTPSFRSVISDMS